MYATRCCMCAAIRFFFVFEKHEKLANLCFPGFIFARFLAETCWGRNILKGSICNMYSIQISCIRNWMIEQYFKKQCHNSFLKIDLERGYIVISYTVRTSSFAAAGKGEVRLMINYGALIPAKIFYHHSTVDFAKKGKSEPKAAAKHLYPLDLFYLSVFFFGNMLVDILLSSVNLYSKAREH